MKFCFAIQKVKYCSCCSLIILYLKLPALTVRVNSVFPSVHCFISHTEYIDNTLESLWKT